MLELKFAKFAETGGYEMVWPADLADRGVATIEVSHRYRSCGQVLTGIIVSPLACESSMKDGETSRGRLPQIIFFRCKVYRSIIGSEMYAYFKADHQLAITIPAKPVSTSLESFSTTPTIYR